METPRNIPEMFPNEEAPSTSSSPVYSRNMLSYTVESAAYPICADGGHRLLYVVEGAGILYLGGCALRITKDDLVYVGRHLSHGFVMDHGARLLMSAISSKDVREFTSYTEGLDIRYLVLHGASLSVALGTALKTMASVPHQLAKAVTTTSDLTSLIDGLVQIMEQKGRSCPPPPAERRDTMAETLYHVAVRPDASLSLLAHKTGLSATYLSRIFKRLYGISFPAYSSIHLINSARRLLIQSSRDVSDVAAFCRYTSIRSFNRDFQAIAGMTPTSYRAAYAHANAVDYSAGAVEKPLRVFYEHLLESCPEPHSITLADSLEEL